MIQEFFGFGGYTREPEGYMSPEHLIFVTSLLLIWVVCAILLGRHNRHKDDRQKNRALIASALLIDGFEILKIVIMTWRSDDAMPWRTLLPLFLCSIQLFTIPLAAFSKGRIKEASLDFVAIFGMLGAVLGTYAASQNYGTYPVLSFDNVVSGITHSISGFAALYILVAGMSAMKKRNIPITCAIVGSFCAAAYTANILVDYNYMFLMRGDGTPYDLLYKLVGGSPIFYPLGVVALFVLYIVAFYLIYYLVTGRRKKVQ